MGIDENIDAQLNQRAPFKILRTVNTEHGGYDFKLFEVATGRLVQGEYRQLSPVAPAGMRHRQAVLNTKAFY